MVKKLTPEQHHILKEKGTEPAFSGKLLHNKKDGAYCCAGCGNVLFSSKEKFDSGSGWPSFNEAEKGAVVMREDTSHGLVRTEITCAKCGGHLGHVFEDGPKGKRFCVNSCALDFDGE
jgi:peptide-methionine (R)-S-oxide reductase